MENRKQQSLEFNSKQRWFCDDFAGESDDVCVVELLVRSNLRVSTLKREGKYETYHYTILGV